MIEERPQIMILKKRRRIGGSIGITHKGEFTPLTVERGGVFQDDHDTNLINLPPEKESPQGADRTKYCEYHRVHGHTIDEF